MACRSPKSRRSCTALGGERSPRQSKGRERYRRDRALPARSARHPQAIATQGAGAAPARPWCRLASLQRRVTQGPPSIRTENAQLVA